MPYILFASIVCLAQVEPSACWLACSVASAADICEKNTLHWRWANDLARINLASTLRLVFKIYFGVNFGRHQRHQLASSTLTMNEVRSWMLPASCASLAWALHKHVPTPLTQAAQGHHRELNIIPHGNTCSAGGLSRKNDIYVLRLLYLRHRVFKHA